MSIASSRREQLDIEAILGCMDELSSVSVASVFRGVTESEVDALLAGSAVKSGKLAGAILLIAQPQEKPHDKADTVLVDNREHMVRIIEQVKVNRKPGWESDDAKLACGHTADELKDLVKQRLHNRRMSGATLMHAGTEEFADTKGGYGWDVKFRIVVQLASENRAAPPLIAISGTTVTLTGTGTLYFTTDGTAPVPGGATVRIYSAPFTAASGDIIRASAFDTNRPLSDFQQKTVA
jgi:hypothetical protein